MIPDLILVSVSLPPSIYRTRTISSLQIILDNGFVQVVGIVPTLIVVQVGLGRAINLGEEFSEETLGPIEAAEVSTLPGALVDDLSHYPSPAPPDTRV